MNNPVAPLVAAGGPTPPSTDRARRSPSLASGDLAVGARVLDSRRRRKGRVCVRIDGWARGRVLVTATRDRDIFGRRIWKVTDGPHSYYRSQSAAIAAMRRFGAHTVQRVFERLRA